MKTQYLIGGAIWLLSWFCFIVMLEAKGAPPWWAWLGIAYLVFGFVVTIRDRIRHGRPAGVAGHSTSAWEIMKAKEEARRLGDRGGLNMR